MLPLGPGGEPQVRGVPLQALLHATFLWAPECRGSAQTGLAVVLKQTSWSAGERSRWESNYETSYGMLSC